MFDYKSLKEFCLSKNGAYEDYPFDEKTLVIKVNKKMFALFSSDENLKISLKCEPMLALALRDKYNGITAGYHLNKKHWNTVAVDEQIPEDEIIFMINHSYELVAPKPKAKINS